MRAILQVENLVKTFAQRRGSRIERLLAVDNVSFCMSSGEVFGVVGESGCGKSTLARCIVRLYAPTSGRILIDGIDISSVSAKHLLRLRARFNMVFQDPTDSLNPRLTVRDAILEPLHLHTGLNRSEKMAKTLDLVHLVGLNAEHLDRYPHQLSTGQRQRVGIARAMISSPALVVLDEPTAALDVSVLGRILELVINLRERFGTAYVVISHDLGVIRHICQRTAVMYLGAFVETGPSVELFDNPLHPYSKALVAAIPRAHPGAVVERTLIGGEVPSPVNLPPGCSFQGRCPAAMAVCSRVKPSLLSVTASRSVACHQVHREQSNRTEDVLLC